MRKLTRRAALAGMATASGAGIVSALGSDGEDALTGGSMSLSEVHKRGDGIWVGPYSARVDISDPSPGDMLIAVDHQVDYYYSDSGSWEPLGVGSKEQPAGPSHFESVKADELVLEDTSG